MAISATALEIFQYTLPAIWLSDSKISFFFVFCFFYRFGGRRGGMCCDMSTCAHWLSLSLSFPPSLSSLSVICSSVLSLSQMNRPIQVKPADSESRGGTVCASSFSPRPKLPFPLLPSFFCSSPTNMLPARISLTIICPIRRCPVPRRGLTARPGRTLQYSERIM